MKNDKQTKASNNPKKSRKGIIIGLSIALGLATSAAVAAPFVLNMFKKTTPTDVTTYRVTFVTNCSATLNPQVVVKGNYATDPAILFDGHTLIGWYDNEACTGEKFNFKTTPINNNIKLYAKWQQDAPITQYKVITYDAGEYGEFDTATHSTSTQTIVEAGTEFKYAVRPTWHAKNEDYGFKEWQVGGEKISDTYKINSNITIKAAPKQNILKQTVTFSINEAGITLTGKTTLTVNKHTKFKQLEKSLPVATYPDKSKVFAYWTLDGVEVDPQHEINANEVYYPYFADVEQNRIIFDVQLEDGQTIKSGSKTFDFTYDAETTMPTFGSFNKPEVVMDGKVFAGWYKDAEFKNEWSNTEQISRQSETPYTYKLYPKFESPVTNPIISFQVDPLSEHQDLTWVGNQIVKCEVPVNVKFSTLIKPAVYSDAEGDPSTGYTSPYYFDKWYTYDSDGKKIDVPETITNSLTIYPEFKEKPILTFKYNNGTKEVEKTVSVNPGCSWEDVKTPSDVIVYKTTEQQYFGYWEGKDSDGNTVKLEPGITIDDIDATKPIVPHYLDTFNVINFITTGVLEDKTTPVTVKYEGTESIGISQEVNYVNDLNKPIPSSNDTTYTKVELVKWQFSSDYNPAAPESATWNDVTPETTTDATTSRKDYYVRPIVKQIVTYTITYDANGGEIEKIKEKTYNTTEVTPSSVFAEIFKPSVKKTDYKFSYWAIKTGESQFEKVSADKTFTEDTTLYAIYDKDEIARKVSFKLTTADAQNKSFPATISGAEYSKNDSFDAEITFGSIPKATVTKYLHNFVGWYFDEACTKPINDSYVLPTGETPTVAYAKFTPAGQYWQLKIKHDDSNYQIIGDDTIYVKNGDKIDLQYGTHDINGITIKKVGYELDGWTDSTGKVDLETTEILQNYDNIVPKFKVAKRSVKLCKGGDDTILGFTDGDTIEVDLHSSLYNAIKDIKPTKSTFEKFGSWCIKVVKDGQTILKPISAEDDIEVSQNIEIYPQFLPQADFVHSNLPYYFDSTAGKYAAITSFTDPNNLIARYADESATSTHLVSKKDFNSEILFGDMMTSIPAHFMEGCTDWNNGGKELTINEEIIYIGDNFLYGCTKFNQNVNIVKTKAETSDITVGINFMAECRSFNKKIDLSNRSTGKGVFMFTSGFLFNCISATSAVVNIAGREKVGAPQPETVDNRYILSTVYKGTGMKITIVVSSTFAEQEIQRLFPDMTGSGEDLYRTIAVEQEQ